MPVTLPDSGDLAGLMPQPMSPQQWANTAATRAGIPLTQAQVQAQQLQNQQTQRQIASQQALQQYFMAQSGLSAPGAPPQAGSNPLTTAPPNAPAPPPGGYPVLPSGLIDRTGAAPSAAPQAQPQQPAPNSPGLPPRAAVGSQPPPVTGPNPSMMGGMPPGVFNTGALARAGVLPADIFALQKSGLDAMKGYQDLNDKQRADFDKRSADANQLLVGLHGASPELQDKAWPSIVSAINRVDQQYPQFATGAPLPDQLPADPQERSQFIQMALGQRNVLGQVLGNAKVAGETAKAAADTAEAQARTPGLSAESDISRMKADAMTAALKDPGSGVQSINIAVPASVNPQLNAAFTAEYNDAMSKGDLTRAHAAISSAVEWAGQRAKAMDAGINQAEVNKAVATEKGVAPIRAGAQLGVESAVARLRNNLEQGNTQRAGYTQSRQVYDEAQAAHQEFQNVLGLANSGNPAAASELREALPGLVARVQGIKSLALAQGDAQLGDVADKAIAGLNGSLGGSIQSGLPQLMDTLSQSTAHSHNLQVQNLNRTYGPSTGVQFQGVPEGPQAPKSAPKYNPGDTVMYQGKPHKVRAVDPATGKLTLEP